MVKPANFIFTTDFPTLKNDASANGTINLAGALSIPANGTLTAFSDFTVGTTGAVTRSRWWSSDDSTWYSGQYHIYDRGGTTGGVPVPYNIAVLVFRTGSNTMRMQVIIYNGSAGIVVGAVAETILMYSETFIPPYA